MKLKKLENWFSMPVLSFWTRNIWWITKKDLTQKEKFVDILRFAIDNWINSIDTAELYGRWWSEEIVWEAIKWYDRKKLFLSSKVMWNNCSYKAIKQACKNILERLKTDYLDLYYIHWRDKKYPLEESIKAMEELQTEWLIKAIWVSNFSTDSLKEAQSYTNYKVVANQVHYNLIYREVEKDWLLDYCQKNDIFLVAYRPLELWKLSNSWNLDHMWLIDKYNKTSSQISLNWLIKQKNVVSIFKSFDKEHILEDMWALWWTLTKEDIEYIRKDYKWIQSKSDCIELA